MPKEIESNLFGAIISPCNSVQPQCYQEKSKKYRLEIRKKRNKRMYPSKWQESRAYKLEYMNIKSV